MVKFFDRSLGKIVEEPAYAEKFLLWCYENSLGKLIMHHVFSKKIPNILYGWYKGSRFSKSQIQKDITKYKIDLSEFQETEFRSYSEFFLRSFKADRRKFDLNKNILPAFAEGRYIGHAEVLNESLFPVKGQFLSSQQLLQNDHWAPSFVDGPLLICRLSPTDYHHFHFPVDGRIIDRYRIHGHYHSVSTHAIRNKSDIFINNERMVTIIDSPKFGKLAMIEVGALCVGKIKIKNLKNSSCTRGEYKGYFDFGASSIILMGEKDGWCPSQDILENTSHDTETLVKLGQPVADKI